MSQDFLTDAFIRLRQRLKVVSLQARRLFLVLFLAARYRHQHVGEIKSLSRFKHRTFFRSPCGNRIVVLRLSVAHDMFREYG